MKPTLLKRLQNPKNRLIRVYDNPECGDRFTVCYLQSVAAPNGVKWFPYRGASSDPFHPQGVGVYAESPNAPIDFPSVRIGRKNHLGRRIPFSDLPADVQKLVVADLTD